MNGLDFLQNMNDIDEDLLESASRRPAKKLQFPVKWAAAAACFLFLVGGGLEGAKLIRREADYQNTVVAFSLEHNSYEIPGLNDYIRFVILPADSYERSSINLESLSKKDLGEEMGAVEIPINGRMVRCRVYHYAAFPENDTICIFEMPGGLLQLYVRKEH